METASPSLTFLHFPKSTYRRAREEAERARSIAESKDGSPYTGSPAATVSLQEEGMTASRGATDEDDDADMKDESSSGSSGDDSDCGEQQQGRDRASLARAIPKTTASLMQHAPLPLPAALLQTTSSTVTHPTSPAVPDGDRQPHGKRPPRLAVSLKNNRYAGYRPWIGDGPEDTMNENVMRNGFADKTPSSSQIESNMARPVIWPFLKTKGVLPALSTLFVQVMDKRQAMGRCTAPSAFKPPPRVTLAEPKREAWLRDLASQDVPLRRLSRTIPHGIRGRPLLDHCLAKQVPIARAIWLIKCVGANEIRAFRRKGITAVAATAGEVKWIKEWTDVVQQFVQAVVDQCGQSDWSQRMQYATRLMSGMFSEDLLDRSDFAAWIIERFSNVDPRRLPVWILLVRLFWEHLVKTQSRCTSLAVAVLAQSDRCSRERHSDTHPLCKALDAFLGRLITTKSATLAAVDNSILVNSQLKRVRAKTTDQTAHARIDSILRRNELLRSTVDQIRQRLKSSQLVLYEFLDTLATNINEDLVFHKCQSIFGKQCSDLATALTTWACTTYRVGSARLYLAVRLLTRLASAANMSLEGPILACLSTTRSHTIEEDNFTRMIHLLVAAEMFNFGVYLQWIISSGAFSSLGPLHISLLTSVADNRLAAQHRSLRQAVLSRLGVLATKDQSTGVALENDSIALLDGLPDSAHRLPDLCARIKCSTMSDKNRIAGLVMDRIDVPAIRITTTQGVSMRSRCLFIAARALLEATKDYSSLHRLLADRIPRSQYSDLSDLAETTLYHAEVLEAMGALRELVAQLYRQHVYYKQTAQLSSTFIGALLSLCRLQPSLHQFVQTLEQDLALSAQQHMAAVCSPASDSLLNVQPGEITCDEDIDSILASGNVMDEQLLGRLFTVIVERTVKWTPTGQQNLSGPCRWFEQLRLFDTTAFDRHMHLLISKLAASVGSEQVRAVYIALIASRCFKAEAALESLKQRLEELEASSTDKTRLSRFAIGVLRFFLPLADLEPQAYTPEVYRFRSSQRIVCSEHWTAILGLMRLALLSASGETFIATATPALKWLRRCYNRHGMAMLQALQERQTHRGPADSSLLHVLLAMSAPHAQAYAQEDASRIVSGLLGEADQLNLTFASLIMAQVEYESQTQYSEKYSNVMATFMREAVDTGIPGWAQMLDCTSGGVQTDLFRNASAHVLGETTSKSDSKEESSDRDDDDHHLQVAAVTRPEEDETVGFVAEKVVHALRASSNSIAGLRSIDGGRDAFSSMRKLLRLAMICTSPSASGRPRTHAQSLLSVLCALHGHGIIQLQIDLTHMIRDCASLAASQLNEAQLLAVYRGLPDSLQRSHEIQFILDHEESSTKWLVLCPRAATLQSAAFNYSHNQAGGGMASPALSPTMSQSGFQAFQRSQSAAAGTLRSPLRPSNSTSSVGGTSPSVPSSPLATSSSQQQSSLRSTGSTSSLSTSLSTGAATAPGSSAAPVSAMLVAAQQDAARFAPFHVRPWEILQDPTPNVGENDTSISLQLFAARKVL